METPWRDEEWLTTALAWIDARLEELGLVVAGTVEQPHVELWSTVLRVPTNAGTVWFKATTPQLRHEATVVEALAARDPDLVPPLLARDPEAGWMLMADAGDRLRQTTDERAWLDVWAALLPRYAQLQLDSLADVTDLQAAGVPHLPLAALPDRYAEILDTVGAERRFHEAVPEVSRLCEALARYDLPDTVQHDDLHDGQVYLRDGRARILDWGDACVSHPFFTLSVTLQGVIAWGVVDEPDHVDLRPFREAYLGPFRAAYGGDLDAAVDVALRLGWVCRAVNGHVPGDDSHTHTRLRMFLDGHP